MPARQQGEKCESQRKLTQQLSQLSFLSEVDESLFSTQGSLADASHSKSEAEAQSCSSSWPSASEASEFRGNSLSLEPESPRPYPVPSHGQQGQAQAQQGHPHRHQLAQAMTKRHQEKWQEAGLGAKLGDGRDQQAGPRSAARKPQGFGARSGEHQQHQMEESKAAELKQRGEGTVSRGLRREKHVAGGPNPHAVLRKSEGPQRVGSSQKADRRRRSGNPRFSQPAAGPRTTASCSHWHATHLQPADVKISAHGRRRHRHEQPAAHLSHGHSSGHHSQGPESDCLSDSSMYEQPRTKQPALRHEQAYMRKKQTHSRPSSATQGELDNSAVGRRQRASQGSHASAQHRLDSQQLPCSSESLLRVSHASAQCGLGSQQLPHGSEALLRVSSPASAEQCAIGSTAKHMGADTQQQLEHNSQSAGLHQTAPESGPCGTLPLPHAPAATVPTVTGLSGTALDAEAQAASGTGPDGSGLLAAAQEVQASAGLTGAAPGAGLQDGSPGPMQALMIALENMTKASQTKLAAMGSMGCQPAVSDAAACPSGGRRPMLAAYHNKDDFLRFLAHVVLGMCRASHLEELACCLTASC